MGSVGVDTTQTDDGSMRIVASQVFTKFESPRPMNTTSETPSVPDPTAPTDDFNTKVAKGANGSALGAASMDAQSSITSNSVSAVSSVLQYQGAASGVFDKSKLKSAFASALIPKSTPLPSSPATAVANKSSVGVWQSSSAGNSQSPSDALILEPSSKKSHQVTGGGTPSLAKVSLGGHNANTKAQVSELASGLAETPRPKTRRNHTYVLPNGDVVHSGKGLGRGRPGIKRGPKKPRTPSNLTNEIRPISRKRKRVSADSGMEHDPESPARAGSPLDSAEEYSPQASQTRSGRHTQRPTTFVPPESPCQKKPRIDSPTSTFNGRLPAKRRIYERKEQNALCEHCLRGYGPVKNAIVFCDGCDRCWHQRCHDPMIPRKLVLDSHADWFCYECTADSAKMKNGEGTGQQDGSAPISNSKGTPETLRRAHLETLPKDKLVDLLMQASASAPNIALWEHLPPPSPTQTPPPSNLSEETNSTPKSQSATGSQDAKDPSTNRGDSHHHDSEFDEFDILNNEHVLLYPKPGNGVQLPPESEDLNMLLEGQGCKTFSHSLREDVRPVGSAVTVAG